MKMDKEQQIEEMARDLCEAIRSCKLCVSARSDIYFREKKDCHYYVFAQKAIEKGYRKVYPIKLCDGKHGVEIEE